MTNPVDLVLGRLEGVRVSGASWVARCPAHDDRHASLSVARGKDGLALLTCHAGCTVEAIVAAIDWTMADLFPSRDELRGPEETVYDIRDAAGMIQAVHVRRDDVGSGKQLFWKRPSGALGLAGRTTASLPLYGAERVAGWDVREPIFLTEGEKAADAVLVHGRPALATVTGASIIPDRDVLEILSDREVILSPDHDVPGVAHMRQLAPRLTRVARSVRWLDPAGWPAKDDLADVLAPGLSAHRLHAMVTGGHQLRIEASTWDELDSRVGEVPGPEPADNTDRTPHSDGSGRSVPGSSDPAPGDDGSAWPEIDPLTLDAPLPPFPLDALPEWMVAMVEAVAANTETDPCMAAVTALGLASVPLSNRFAVVTRTWSERGVNLFTASIADSGELKSAVVGALAEPLRRHEREVLADEAPGRSDRERGRKDAELRLGIARDEVKKAMKADHAARAAAGEAPKALDGGQTPHPDANDPAGLLAAARAHLHGIQAELEADDEEQTAPYALLADDSTPEALQRQMAQQDGRVGMVSAESELFLMAAGRYSDKAPNLQVYLSGFSGEPLRGDRITRDMPPVEHPGLTIVISTQPVVFEEARRNPYLQRRGLLARFLFALPISRAGRRHLADRPFIPPSVEHEYSDMLMRLCRLGDAHRAAAPVQLRLIGEAGRRLETWHDEVLEPRRDRETGDLGACEPMAAWSGRLHGLVVRLAGLLHVAEHLDEAASLTIEPATVDAAIAIAEWATEHAFAAFGIDRLDRVGHDALRLRRWYRGRLGGQVTFTLRDACRGLRGLDAEQVRAAIGRLEDHGHLRMGRSRSGRAGGRPSDIVTINPADVPIDDRG